MKKAYLGNESDETVLPEEIALSKLVLKDEPEASATFRTSRKRQRRKVHRPPVAYASGSSEERLRFANAPGSFGELGSGPFPAPAATPPPYRSGARIVLRPRARAAALPTSSRNR